MSSTRYDLEDRLVAFGAATCRLCARLPQNSLGKQVMLQLIRCSTSPFANYGEVQGAESRRDFIHKLRVCVKELRETRAWFKFIQATELRPDSELAALRSECDELLAILSASIRTAERNAE